MSRSSTIVGLVAACALAALGCKQGLGDRCEINSDCSSGFCSMNGAGIGGTCVDLSRPTTTGQGGSGGTSSTGNDGASGGAGGGDAGGDTGVDAPAGNDGAEDTAAPDDSGVDAPSVADDAAAG